MQRAPDNHFALGRPIDGRTLYFRRRSIEPAAFSCSNPHSRRTSPTFPSLRLSRPANSSRSALRTWRTRKLICAFHSPIVCLRTSCRRDKQRTQRLSTRFVHLSVNVADNQDNTTSARCFLADFLAGFLGLGRPTAFALLPSGLQLPEVFRSALGDLLPTLPSKCDGGGIFFLR